MSSKSRGSVQIVVALLGALGLIGAAIFNHWDKIFPKVSQPPPSPSPPSVSVSPSPSVSTTPSLESLYAPEVKSVIQRSMILGSEAYWNLDSSLLEEVFTENALKLLQDHIAQYRSSKRRIDSQSKDIHYIDISFMEQPLRAKVKFTRYLRLSVYSLQTGQCIEATPEYQQELTYNLRYQTNGWKIFAIEFPPRTPEEKFSCHIDT